MSGVFRNKDPPPPHSPASVGGRAHSLGGEGVGGSIVRKTPRHCSVLYICKYFVIIPNPSLKPLSTRPSIVGGPRRIQIKSVLQYVPFFICLFYFISLFSDGKATKQIQLFRK
jgi:hypothetical protein